MAYTDNPQYAVDKILSAKGDWAKANEAGDDEKKNAIAQNAQQWYKQLRDMGYSDVAQKLNDADYTGAQKVRDNFSKTGKIATKDYMYTLGQGYGMTKADVDSIVKFDNDTGEVTIGGINVGKPYSVVDGVSYWSDTKPLDDAFGRFVTKANITPTLKAQAGMAGNNYLQQQPELFNKIMSDSKNSSEKYDKLNDYTYNHNPYKSSIGKEIMKGFRWDGYNAANNAKASGASSNGGNVDSYAAANASRQQLAYEVAGKRAVLDDYNTRVNNVLAQIRGENADNAIYNGQMYDTMQSGLGASHQFFNDAETERLNTQAIENDKVQNDILINQATGKNTKSQMAKISPYLNEDGTVKDTFLSTEFDATGGFDTLIEEKERQLANTTEPTERAKILDEISNLDYAKTIKTGSDSKYAKYAGDITGSGTVANAERYNNEVQNAVATYLSKMGYDTDVKVNEMNNAAAIESQRLSNEGAVEQAKINAQSALDQIKAQTDSTIKVMDKEAEIVNKHGEDKEVTFYSVPKWRQDGKALENVSDSVKDLGYYLTAEELAILGDDYKNNADTKEAYAMAMHLINFIKNGPDGKRTEDEIIKEAVAQSGRFKTGKKALGNVFGALGVDKTKLWQTVVNIDEDGNKGVRFINENDQFTEDYLTTIPKADDEDKE